MRKYKREFNVYRIVNDVDSMVYVGSTTTELWHRFGQHKADAKNGEKSPLYELMRKHGVSHFRIEPVMVSTKDTIRRDEQNAIRAVPKELRLNYKMRSENDTSQHFDYDEICKVYLSCGSQNMTANIVGCSRITVQKALKSRGVKIEYPPHTAHRLLKSN